MTHIDRLNSCHSLVVDNLFEPSQNRLTIQVTVGITSENTEMVTVSGVELGPYKKVDFDNGETYEIFFNFYISYFVINESFDSGMSSEYIGGKIRRYANSSFIEFCKEQNIYFKLWDDKDIIHYGIITEHHVIHVLTTSEPQISKRE